MSEARELIKNSVIVHALFAVARSGCLSLSKMRVKMKVGPVFHHVLNHTVIVLAMSRIEPLHSRFTCVLCASVTAVRAFYHSSCSTAAEVHKAHS